MYFNITGLTCNHMAAPCGMDDLPRFSYRVTGDIEAGTAEYRIAVYREDRLIWTCEGREADREPLIPYGGPTPEPLTAYTWQVTLRDGRGETVQSEKARFVTGNGGVFPADAKWITHDPFGLFVGDIKKPLSSVPCLRREFTVEKPVKEAYLAICGVGLYACYLNGISVKDTLLDPPFTEYDKAVLYKVHEITGLKEGKNALAILLGDGFYNADTHESWNFYNASWRDHNKCICALTIRYTDGTEETVCSGRSFRGNKGPYLASDIRSADRYDARIDLGDWMMPGYDDSAWQEAAITRSPGGMTENCYTTPVRVTAVFPPAAVNKVSDKVWVFDAGVNTAGFASLSVTAPAGTELVLRYDEQVKEDGSPSQALSWCLHPEDRQSYQTDHYIARGGERESWHPLFKYHGYRYVSVFCETGIPEDLTLMLSEVRTDLAEIGHFSCSDDTLNKLQEITCRATRTNFHHMPTDCPHREKNGWTGDAQLSAEQLLYNYDGAAAYSRWMRDVIRAQRPSGQLPGIVPSTGWGFNWGSGPAYDSVCAVIPYNIYLFTGDKRILAETYPCLKKYLAFCSSMAEDGICAFGLADWCAPTGSDHRQCENAVTDTAYYYDDARVAALSAELLGLPAEAAYYRTLAETVRKSFRRRFIGKRDGLPALINCTECQTSLACVLYYGLAEEEERPFFLKALTEDIIRRGCHLDVGIYGAKYVCHVLCDTGYADLMVKAVTNPTYPSYGYMTANGATTLWETWEGEWSRNHHMFGDISACLYRGIAGIRPDPEVPGFRHTVFRPQFVSSLTHAAGEHLSPYGTVAVRWKREGDRISLTVTVPPCCTGDLYLPAGTLFADGERAKNLTSGTFSFEILLT